MNAPDVRRLLDDLGSVQTHAPDDEFLDRLEFQLRAEAIALAPDTYDAAPWRLPFGIAAAAFSVVVGVAGITVMRDLPHRQVSAQLAAVSDVMVEHDGKEYQGHSGMVVPEGAIVRVGPSGSATINGIVYSPGQTLRVGDDGRIEAGDEDETGDSEFATGADEPAVEIGAITVPVPTDQPRAAVAPGPESPETTSGGSSVPSTTASPSHDVTRSEKPDPAEVIGLADDAPGPASPSTPRSTTETTAGQTATTSAPKTTTTAVDPSTTSGDPSTSSTTPSTTVPATGDTVTPPTVDDGAVTDTTTVPSTTVPAPPGGTTTTTIPVDTDGDDGPAVDPDGGDGDPVDPAVDPDGGDGDVVPAGGDEGEPFDGGDGDVVPAGGDEGEPFDDGTGDDGASGSDDAGTGGTTDDETAGPSDTTTPAPGSGDTASS